MRTQTQPSCRWLSMKASQASRCARSELNSCSSPSSDDFAGVDRTAHASVPPCCGWWFFHWRIQRLECTRSLIHTKEPWARPMCPGDLLGDHSQRAIALAVIFEPVLAYEDGMGVSAPPPHQARAGLQHAAGVD